MHILGLFASALLGCALLGCKEPQAASADPARSAADAGQAKDGAEAARSCEDRWLKAHDLNEYGDPPDTMYTGGTPLFDERTGQRKDRIEEVRKKHPALAKECAAGGKDAG